MSSFIGDRSFANIKIQGRNLNERRHQSVRADRGDGAVAVYHTADLPEARSFDFRKAIAPSPYGSALRSLTTFAINCRRSVPLNCFAVSLNKRFSTSVNSREAEVVITL